jgi:glycerate kinase
VCAPTAFKGSLTAGDAAAAMALGVADAGADPVEVAVADGGDGTLDVLLASDGASRVVTMRVTGPLGDPVTARLGLLNLGDPGGGTAVVEMAEASGLRLLRADQLDALHATSRGAGELIAAALNQGLRRLIVGVGGSASTDGGAGALQALGARLLDAAGRDLPPGGAALRDLVSIDVSGLDPRLSDAQILVAVDVRSPLLGAEGAAAVFAPQKGATAEDVAVLEAGLARLASVAGATELAHAAGAGAAGGAAFGFALAGARLVPGAPTVCDLVHLDAALAAADIVLTGEGRLDAQTALGKAPAEVAQRSAAAGVPCIAIAGAVVEPAPHLFAAAISLEELLRRRDPRKEARTLLRQAAAHAVLRYGVRSRAGGTRPSADNP